jgi:hypothetical protein
MPPKPKPIDLKLVENLAQIGCKSVEIAKMLGISVDTLDRRCAEELAKGRANLRVSLRRWQLEAAKKGNITMLIWLGKQYLGQTEKVEETTEIKQKAQIVYESQWGNAQEPDKKDS